MIVITKSHYSDVKLFWKINFPIHRSSYPEHKTIALLTITATNFWYCVTGILSLFLIYSYSLLFTPWRWFTLVMLFVVFSMAAFWVLIFKLRISIKKRLIEREVSPSMTDMQECLTEWMDCKHWKTSPSRNFYMFDVDLGLVDFGTT